MVRLQKYLAESGIASRRASEQVILEGRVCVNGTVVSQMGAKVDPACDRVSVDGKTVTPRRKLYIALNKPAGYLCARKAEVGRNVIGDLLPKEWTGLFPVGRLDCQTEGLIFLTNDGDFCLKLTHPRYGICKTYLAWIEGRVEPEMLDRFKQGVRSGGDLLKAAGARLHSANNTTSVAEVKLSEGKNREVRRLFESVGLAVARLIRVQIGPIKLGELPSGKWRALTRPEIVSLLAETS
jgi:23S rRNA pseudouridine2605 synthase